MARLLIGTVSADIEAHADCPVHIGTGSDDGRLIPGFPEARPGGAIRPPDTGQRVLS
jgi:hypothetical protein